MSDGEVPEVFEVFEVLAPGLLTTIQDAGRPGLGHLGIGISGAADPWSLAVANRLLGNPEGAAALELTIVGPDLRALRPLVIALAGADLGAMLEPGGRHLAAGRTHHLPAGAVVRFPGGPGPGIRAVLAVPGGFDVPVILGSRSTSLAGGFGGVAGRPLRAGDRLALVANPGQDQDPPKAMAGLAWPDGPLAARPGRDGAWHVRILPGPAPDDDAARHQADGRVADLVGRHWTVSPVSDRMGLRLAGSPLAGGAGSVLTHGVTWGTVQLPPDGQPIILLADHQPTGGYPVIAIAINADRPILGQAGPGDHLRFSLVTAGEARAAELDRRRRLEAATRAVRSAADLDEPWRSAGG